MTIKNTLQQVNIGVRLAAVTAAVIGVSLGAFSVVSMLRQRAQLLAATEDDARRLIESLESTLRVQMLRGDSHLGEAVTRIARPKSVQSVILATHEGKIRYATDRATVGRRIGIADERCSGCHPSGGARKTARRIESTARVYFRRDESVVSAVMPILNEASCSRAACHTHTASNTVLGLMEVDLTYAEVARSRRAHYLQMGLLALGIVVVTSVLLILLIRRWVSRPVALLVEGTRQIAAGDLDHRIPESEGELGELARAFNQMQEQLKSTRQQIVLSERLACVGKLAASVAHELNNPLTGILTFAEELYEESKPDDPSRSDFEVIRGEALRCREIVRNLLDFSKQKQPSLRLTSLVEVVRSTLKLVQRLAAFHNVAIVREVPPDLPLVHADASQLQQVLLNLLVNGAEAMPGGGSLTISGRFDREEERVKVSISDTGHGIKREDLTRIFEPFFSTKGGKTTGLGLAISWSIVDQHGGKLEASSVEGEGTTFTVSLPAAQ